MEHEREPEAGCVSDEVASTAAGPEPAAFAHDFNGAAPYYVAAGADSRRIGPPPAETAVAVDDDDPIPPPTRYYAADDDEVDDAPERGIVVRPARVDPRLTDPDTLERAKRVEVYRLMIEQDPSSSLFTRPESPPRRVIPAPRTL